ncbi:MAG: putative rane protein domain [Firmicutes bacterium]|nr:putative rane protein domain [Bacillota bacterium]
MKVGFSYVTAPARRRVGLSVLIGIITGIIGAIAKWGWEVPFPPRNPDIFFPIGELSRVTPPKVFLDMLGLPSDWTYTFSGVIQPLSVFIVHVGFSLVFALTYCVIAEYWPRIKMWQGTVFGFFCYVGAHVIVMPLIGLVPPLSELPFDEHLSELFGHFWWLWIIEVARRDLRNRMTGEPDPEK